MLNTASRGAPRVRNLQAHRSSLACTTCQQRYFQFVPRGCNAAEDESRSEEGSKTKRRRGFAYRYMQSRSKQWLEKPEATSVDPELVRATEALKETIESRPLYGQNRPIHVKRNLKPDEAPGARPGRSIEDVERELVNHLFRSHSEHSKVQHDVWENPLRNIRNRLYAEKAPKEVVDTATTTAQEVDDAQIDPITNRRIAKQHVGEGESSTFTPKFEDVDHHPNLQPKVSPDNCEKVHWNEPNGLPKVTREEESKRYDDLHEYTPRERSKPDSLRGPSPEGKVKAFDDLDIYNGSDRVKASTIQDQEATQTGTTVKGNYIPPKIEGAAEDQGESYTDLGKYKAAYWNEPDGLPKPTPEEASKNYDDLHLYGQVKWNEPDGLPYTTTEESTKQYADMDRYDPQNFDSPAPTESYLPRESSNTMFDLGSQTQRSQPQGISAKSSSNQSSGNNDSWDGKHGSTLDKLTADEIRANVLRRVRKQSLSKEQHRHDAAAVYRKEWNPIMEEAHDELEKEYPRKLTGNYARDFPEEFTTSWSTKNSPSRSTLSPTDKAGRVTQHENELGEEPEPSSMDESFPSDSSRLEPALNRHARGNSSTPASCDSLEESKVPDGRFQEVLKTAEEAFAEQHRHPKKQSISTASATSSAEPATYKILAYDSTTDLVRTAETSSTVHDTSAPLTPADVIPKLSNPAKFFVHFSDLQDQGYQIVSGERDVLVFRKIRVSPTSGAKSSVEASPKINPIDMMGKPPITGNFASPTGFVNYDAVEEVNPKPEPPFRFNTDSREAPQASELRGPDVGKAKKKRSLGKRVILGTVYVAGGAYAVGVMGEYFATRGAPAPRPGVEPGTRRL